MLNTVFTNDVRQTLDQFRRSVDQLFENFYGFATHRPMLGSATQEAVPYAFSPVLESGWSDNFLLIRAILPGVPADDVKAYIQNNQLVIEGERRIPESVTRHTYTQLAYGKFYTAVTMPSGLNLEKLSCQLHDGVLDIKIPVVEMMKPRQIPIETEEQKKQIVCP